MQFSKVRGFVVVPGAPEFVHQPEHPRQALLAVASVGLPGVCFDPNLTSFDISCATIPRQSVRRGLIVESLEFAPGMLEQFFRIVFVSSVEGISAAYVQVQAGTDQTQGDI